MQLHHRDFESCLARLEVGFLGDSAVRDITSSAVSVSKQVLPEEIAQFSLYGPISIVDYYYFLEAGRHVVIEAEFIRC